VPIINHNIPSMITGNALRNANQQMQGSLEKLSTGLRINRASDDAAGLGVSEKLRAQVAGLSVGGRNAQDGVSLVNIAEGALNEVESMLQRMRELSIQASNDTLTSVERGFAQVEFDQLRNEIDRIVHATQYNSTSLLDGTSPWGTANGGIIHIGANNVTINDEIHIIIPSINTNQLGISVTDNVWVSDQQAATASIDTLDLALRSINTLRSSLGAVTNRLQDAITNQENQEQNMQAAESAIRDADFAKETTNYTRNQILVQSSTAMLAQANTLPQNILTLLKG
jgi:flagellin